MHGVPPGIIPGLIVGKLAGIWGMCWLAVKAGMTSLPGGMNSRRLFGTSALCGIGFTMSLFIGSPGFEETGMDLLFDERLGILVESLVSGLIGYLILCSKLSKAGGRSG